MVATPHCNIPGMYDNYFGKAYIDIFRKTEEMLIKEGIPLMLYAGMEVFVTSDLIEKLSDGKILTLNGGHYLLVEFSFDEDPEFAEHMLEELARVKIYPVIAHPERYEFVKSDMERVYEWRRKGYMIQVNKGSLLGRFGNRSEYVAHELMRHRLVSVIASDAHSPVQRTPYLLDVYEELKQLYPKRYLHMYAAGRCAGHGGYSAEYPVFGSGPGPVTGYRDPGRRFHRRYGHSSAGSEETVPYSGFREPLGV